MQMCPKNQKNVRLESDREVVAKINFQIRTTTLSVHERVLTYHQF